MSKELYHLIASGSSGPQAKILTVLEGACAGEKALFDHGGLQWLSDKDGFFSQTADALPEFSVPGIHTFCGSTVYCESPAREARLVICGGGHVSLPVIRIGRMIGCTVTVLEDRPKFADNARRAGANEVICAPFEEGLKRIPGDSDTFFILVTRGHRYDLLCLEQVLQKAHAYIGMMGSRKRTAMVRDTLLARGADPVMLDSVHMPIGLPIGAETPEEIGVSIMAEIIQEKNRSGSRGGFTREILQAILDEKDADIKKVLATIVARKGSSPRAAGTKMVIFRDGRTAGTIGGGCLEADIFQKALQLMNSEHPAPVLVRADMTGRDAEEDGMVCGGILDVLLEVV
jgi:xanthine/CO dehydrogenase XdhC/CoxF family maturation factor